MKHERYGNGSAQARDQLEVDPCAAVKHRVGDTNCDGKSIHARLFYEPAGVGRVGARFGRMDPILAAHDT